MDALFFVAMGLMASAGVILLPLLQDVAKEVGAVLLSMVVAEKRMNDYFTTGVVVDYFINNSRTVGRGVEVTTGERSYVRPEERYRTVFYRMDDFGWQLFLYRGRPVLFHKSVSGAGARFFFFRRTLNWDKVLMLAADSGDAKIKQSLSKNRFVVVHHSGSGPDLIQKGQAGEDPESDFNKGVDHSFFRPPVGWAPDDIGAPIPDNFLEFLSLSAEAQKVVEDVKFWYTHRKWYKERGIPWRRGWLLYGVPGNGKTSLVRALAQHLDMPVHTFDLASMDNDDLIQHWNRAHTDGDSRIVLLEDIDSVFHGRENVVQHSDLTFDGLLNVIDGIEQDDGLLLFVTTNKVEHIDPALGSPFPDGTTTRPGRLDRAAELPGLDMQGRLKMARRILKDEEAAEKLALDSEAETAVQFQERCIRYALKNLFGG